MKLLTRASGALKDLNSIFISSLARRTASRNPEIDAVVIKATSHDEFRVDYKNVQRVFLWLRTSPSYSKPLFSAIARRMERTRSWIVALKGLMLMHGVFCCDVPAINKIGRLPFDLSDFSDAHSGLSKAWCVNAFVRSYFSFLDQKSAILARDVSREGRVNRSRINEPVAHQLLRLDELQTLLDELLRVKPLTEELMLFGLINEAMDCVIVEIFQTYSFICDGIARVLLRIYESGRLEAAMALRILKRATGQGQRLKEYFEFCRKFGVLNGSELPKVVEIPEEDIKELERIITGAVEKVGEMEESVVEDEKQMMVLKTAVSEKWEVFDDQVQDVKEGKQTGMELVPAPVVLKTAVSEKWEVFDDQVQDVKEGKQAGMELVPAPVVVPDLITF